jgi:hypothetical protein
MEMVRFVRSTIGAASIDLADKENRRELSELLKTIVKRDNAKGHAAVERMERAPWNARAPSKA